MFEELCFDSLNDDDGGDDDGVSGKVLDADDTGDETDGTRTASGDLTLEAAETVSEKARLPSSERAPTT